MILKRTDESRVLLATSLPKTINGSPNKIAELQVVLTYQGVPAGAHQASVLDHVVIPAILLGCGKDRDPATPEEIERARNDYAKGSDDDIEIDDDALTSRADNGTWVQAWVWLPHPCCGKCDEPLSPDPETGVAVCHKCGLEYDKEAPQPGKTS